MTPCYVFDLDGTLADLTDRLQFIQHEKPDWDGFFAACDGDTVIEPVATLFRELNSNERKDYDMIIMSGRSDAVRGKTWNWLDDNNLKADWLFMRADGDHRPDDIVKSELMDRLLSRGFKPIMIFEDRKQVVDMWRSRGFLCAQVAEGNF